MGHIWGDDIGNDGNAINHPSLLCAAGTLYNQSINELVNYLYDNSKTISMSTYSWNG